MQATKNNNLSLIKDQLEKGKRITSISVLKSIGTTETRHYLSILRKEGLIIKYRWIQLNGKHFKEWFLK